MRDALRREEIGGDWMRLRRCVLLFLLLFVGVLSVTRVTYADDMDRWREHPYVNVDAGSDTVDSEVYEAIPNAGEQLACSSGLDAASWCLGKDPRTLTDLQKAYLGDSSFSPYFVDYAASFDNTIRSINIYGFVGTGYQYLSEGFSRDDYDTAKAEFDNIIAGLYPSNSDAQGLAIHPNYGNDRAPVSLVATDGNSYGVGYKSTDAYNSTDTQLLWPDSGTVLSLPENLFSNYPAGSEYETLVTVLIANNSLNQRSATFSFYVVKRGSWSLSYEALPNHLKSYFGEGLTRTQSLSIGDSYYYYSKQVRPTFDGTTLVFPEPASSVSLTSCNSNDSITVRGADLICYGDGAGVGDPTGDWPDPRTVEPEPEPDPPSPPDPDIPIPDPPDLPDPDDPIVVSEPTEYTDYVPWLRAILAALNAINQSLSEHCYHIRVQIVSSTNWLYDAIEVLLTTLFDALNDYLYELITWLVEVLRRAIVGAPVRIGDTVVNVDTNSIVTLLKAILLKLDELVPESDPLQGFWDLLNSILAGIVAALVSGALGLIGGMASAVEGLASKFPFSLPWDLITIVGLFAHDPVTPVFDLPLALPNGGLGSVHVDLSDWDTVMVSVRAVQMALFGYGLARKTPDVVQMLDSIFAG